MELTPASASLSRKGRKYLDALIATKEAHPDAVQAALNLVDPFPDGAFKRVGWPDGKSVNAVPVVWNDEFSISAPNDLDPGVTWSAHISMSPFTRSRLENWDDTTNSVSTYDATTGVIGVAVNYENSPATVQVFTWGDDNPPVSGAPMPAAYQAGVPRSYTQNPHRITCFGIEAICTGAYVNRGGMGYAYRVPSDVETLHVQNSTGTAPASARLISSSFMSDRPQLPGDVVNYPNTYVGSAKDGIVAISTPANFTNRALQNLAATYYRRLKAAGNTAELFKIESGELGTAPSCWSHSGIFLTGLTQGTSYTIRTRMCIETFPSVEDEYSVSLSDMVTPHSPVLEEVLFRILRDMPAGFDYAENPFGEWFDSILGAVSKFAPMIGGALGSVIPGAQLIGQGIGAVANAASSSKAKKVAAAKKTTLSSQQLPAQPSRVKRKKNGKIRNLGPKPSRYAQLPPPL
jgi:hypothetical protein